MRYLNLLEEQLVEASRELSAATFAEEVRAPHGGHRRWPRVRAQLRRAGIRRRTALVLLAALVAASGAAAAVSLSGGSTTSIPLSGGGVLCPAGFEYLAYARLGRVYPPNYPATHPRNAGTTSCFASLRDAERAGYALAQLPAGDTRIGPIYLSAAPNRVVTACAASARLVKLVYCPTRLPAPWVTSNLCPTRAACLRIFDLEGAFLAPSSYLGTTAGAGDVTIWAASRSLPTELYGAGCLGALHPIDRLTVDRRPATLYACQIQASPNGGLVLEWQTNHNSFGIAIAGQAAVNRRLIAYVAAHLRPVRFRR